MCIVYLLSSKQEVVEKPYTTLCNSCDISLEAASSTAHSLCPVCPSERLFSVYLRPFLPASTCLLLVLAAYTCLRPKQPVYGLYQTDLRPTVACQVTCGPVPAYLRLYTSLFAAYVPVYGLFAARTNCLWLLWVVYTKKSDLPTDLRPPTTKTQGFVAQISLLQPIYTCLFAYGSSCDHLHQLIFNFNCVCGLPVSCAPLQPATDLPTACM
ncbi:hypothetical protein O6H91_Y496600 [Diphasiastrum complanatum]|nr:hypothetical protein O6H91_Y496600 [Diphasiastrum complanatum]